MDSQEWRFPIDESKKQKSLSKISQAVYQKKVRYSPSFIACIIEQLRYQSWRYWGLQGGVLLLAVLLMAYLNKSGEKGISIAICSLFMVLSGNICLSGMGRLFSWNMAELEQTLYLNLKQMVCIHLLVAGVLDVVVLVIIATFSRGLFERETGAYLLYLLVPFLWSDILYLRMLTVFRGGMGEYRQLSAGIICGILAVFPSFFEKAYHPAYLPVWGVLVIIEAGILILVIRRLIGKIEGGEVYA